MAGKKSRKKLVATVAVLIVLLALIGTIAILKAIAGDKTDPYAQKAPDTSDQQEAPKDTSTETKDDETDSTDTPDATPSIDPATVSTIDIGPMNLTVSYVKGVGGFEFEVLRTASGGRYVEFRNETLIGTKCTDDEGTFASILQDPSNDEAATLSKKTTLDGTVYGLSLPETTCTSNPELLEKYQKSFSDAFPLLKKIE